VKRVIFLSQAEEEMNEAASWYELNCEGLGQKFLSRIQGAVSDLAERPKACQLVRGHIRRKLVRQFPYAVLFREDPDVISIIAISHLRRRPGYWVKRLG
jgi:plasmid stabilization system protein ParE